MWGGGYGRATNHARCWMTPFRDMIQPDRPEDPGNHDLGEVPPATRSVIIVDCDQACEAPNQDAPPS